MRVGVLTGGGDCPGLNAVIRALVRKGERFHGDTFVGFRNGWRGVMDDHTVELTTKQEEVLEKISRQGKESLTEEEREILRRASEEFRKRRR